MTRPVPKTDWLAVAVKVTLVPGATAVWLADSITENGASDWAAFGAVATGDGAAATAPNATNAMVSRRANGLRRRPAERRDIGVAPTRAPGARHPPSLVA